MNARGFGSVLLRRAARIGQSRADRVSELLCIEIGVILPDVEIIRERGGVRLTGRGLRRRWWANAALRWLGRMLR